MSFQDSEVGSLLQTDFEFLMQAKVERLKYLQSNLYRYLPTDLLSIKPNF